MIRNIIGHKLIFISENLIYMTKNYWCIRCILFEKHYT
jgi:hypothetical protein